MSTASPTPGPSSPAPPFGGARAGQRLGPLEVTVSTAANDRYWSAAGADHPLLRDGLLYPPIAANLGIWLFQTVATEPLLHATQRLVCHRSVRAGTPLVLTGRVLRRFEKRGREYAEVEAIVAAADAPDEPIWTSVATFCEARAR